MSEPLLTADEAELPAVAQLRAEVTRGLVPAHAVALFVHRIERDAVAEAEA